MSAYGSQDAALPGLLDGLFEKVITTKIVQAGESFEFGDPVFYDQGDENKAYQGDNTDASLVFGGVCPISQRSTVTTEAVYEAYASMNVLERGRVWVRIAGASDLSGVANKKAYVVDDPNDADYGKFSATSTDHYDANAWFRSEPVLVGSELLIIVELQGLNAGSSAT